jgi:hypothetical protein
MRLIKDAHEQAIMRRAAQISAGAHIRAMQLLRRMLRAGQDVREYHLDAELLHEFRRHGSQYPAYGSIVAAGANACVLHYRADTAPIRERRAGADRRRLRARRLRQRHHPHLPGQRPLHRPAARAVRPGAGQPGGRHGRHQSRRALHRPARRHRVRAGAGHARPGPARQEQGRQSLDRT